MFRKCEKLKGANMHFPVFKIYQDSFKHAWSHKLPWFRVAFAPAMLYLLGFIVLGLSYVAAGSVLGLEELLKDLANNTSEDPLVTLIIGIGNVLNFIISIAASISFLLKGFRYGVFGEGGQKWWSFQLNKRFVKIFLYFLLVGLLAVLYVLIAGGISVGTYFAVSNLLQEEVLAIVLAVILGGAFVIFGIFLMFRIYLTFLLIAVDEIKALRTSWHMLKGNVWRLIFLILLIALTVGAIILFGVLILALLGILSYFVSPILVAIIVALGIAFVLFTSFIYWAVGVKALSLVYLTLKKGTTA